MAEAWTNSALQTLINTEGDKIRCIKSTCFCISLYVPITGQPIFTVDDLTLTSIGGTDVIKVKRYNPNTKKFFYEYCTTSLIEKITVVEDSGDTVDPYNLQF